jgi:hypothetical protein
MEAPSALEKYPLDRRLDGPQSRSGHSGSEEKKTALLGNEPRSSPWASHYTDSTIQIPTTNVQDEKSL